MATAAKITGQITRWWWVRHAPVPNPEARCYGQTDKDCDVNNPCPVRAPGPPAAQGRGVVRLEPVRARKTAETLALTAPR